MQFKIVITLWVFGLLLLSGLSARAEGLTCRMTYRIFSDTLPEKNTAEIQIASGSSLRSKENPKANFSFREMVQSGSGKNYIIASSAHLEKQTTVVDIYFHKKQEVAGDYLLPAPEARVENDGKSTVVTVISETPVSLNDNMKLIAKTYCKRHNR